jgi:hydroxyacylglutathione hydrolase
MSGINVDIIDAFEDNYLFVILEHSGLVACVDPGDGEAVEKYLKANELELDVIFITHHHPDHIGGVSYLKKKYKPIVIASEDDKHRIPADEFVSEGDRLELGDSFVDVISIPGHTSGHVAYHFADNEVVFVGDALFHLGCGRLFEGSAEQMWSSLKKLKKLDPDTSVFCAHEYSEANAKFCLSIDPNNKDLIEVAAEITELRAKGERTIPFELGSNLVASPFLRADDETLKAELGMSGQADNLVFAEIRKRKDEF